MQTDSQGRQPAELWHLQKMESSKTRGEADISHSAGLICCCYTNDSVMPSFPWELICKHNVFLWFTNNFKCWLPLPLLLCWYICVLVGNPSVCIPSSSYIEIWLWFLFLTTDYLGNRCSSLYCLGIWQTSVARLRLIQNGITARLLMKSVRQQHLRFYRICLRHFRNSLLVTF